MSANDLSARAHFLRGKSLETAGQLYAAAGEYLAALALKPSSGGSRRSLQRVELILQGQRNAGYFRHSWGVWAGAVGPLYVSTGHGTDTWDLIAPSSTYEPIEEDQLDMMLARGLNGGRIARSIALRRIRESLPASDEVAVRYAYYPVYGRTEAEIRGYIDRVHLRTTGAPHDALTKWSLQYTWRADPDAGAPIALTSVRDSITIVLPQWHPAPGDDPDPLLSAQWSEYIDRLNDHELGHVMIATALLAAFEDRLRALPPDATTPQIESLLNRTASDYHQYDAYYDRITDNGATQGAAF